MPATVAVDTAQQVLDKYKPVMTNLRENYPKAKLFGMSSILIVALRLFFFGMIEINCHLYSFFWPSPLTQILPFHLFF